MLVHGVLTLTLCGESSCSHIEVEEMDAQRWRLSGPRSPSTGSEISTMLD